MSKFGVEPCIVEHRHTNKYQVGTGTKNEPSVVDLRMSTTVCIAASSSLLCAWTLNQALLFRSTYL